MSKEAIIVGVVMLTVAGCNSAYEVREVSGANGKFCVPTDRIVDRIPWIPSVVPKGGGFAFSGCWRPDLKGEEACSLPKMVVGGVVDSPNTFRKARWRDFDDNSLIKRTTLGEGSSLEVVEGGREIVVSNKRMYWGWFVWRKVQPLVDDTSAGLDSDDELVVACQEKDVASSGISKTRRAILCERKVLGRDFALSYSFESASRVPKDIDELDVQLFRGIDQWRCRE